MNTHHLQIIESLLIILIYVIAIVLINKLVDKTTTKKFIAHSRALIIKRAIHFTMLVMFLILLFTAWGVNQSEIVVFVGSVLTVIGVALFAQWSILSNITSSVIIFFNHSVKIDDTIKILEAKDYEIEGKIINIGLFFVTLQTSENDEITLPNNVFIQKMIKKTTSIEPTTTP